MKHPGSNGITYLKNGFLKGVGFAAGLLTTSVFAAAAAMNVFSSGQTISAAQINQNFAMAAPEGAVIAFYLTACPEGWAPADGTNGTPDLRGQFIRGRNDVGTGARSDGFEDPAGNRAIGDALQSDAFQGHFHGLSVPGFLLAGDGTMDVMNEAGPYLRGQNSVTIGVPISDGSNGSPRTATETRPKNVALTYCMRKN